MQAYKHVNFASSFSTTSRKLLKRFTIVTGSNTDYSVNTASLVSPVVPAGSTTFTVTFTPQAAGPRNTVLRTGYLVYRTYQSAFGDMPGAPVPLNFSEFSSDSAIIGNGLIVNATGWQAKLEANKQAYLLAFVSRSRFTSAYPATLTPVEFVDQLFLNGGVIPGSRERAAAIAEFGSAVNTADTAVRARALRQVAENGALDARESNSAFVLMQYFGYLGRDPNALPDGDYSGYEFWLNKLNSFNGDFRRAEMVKAFLVAGEYRSRFAR